MPGMGAYLVVPGLHGVGDGVQQARIAAKVGEALAKIDGLVLLRQGRHGAEDGGAHLGQAAGEGGVVAVMGYRL